MQTKASQSTSNARPITMADLTAAQPNRDANGQPKVTKVACGGGLILQLTPGRPMADGRVAIARSWIGRYADPKTGKDKWPGLGTFDPKDPGALDKVRAKLAEIKTQAAKGIDPAQAKVDAEARAIAAAAAPKTFYVVAEAYIDEATPLRRDRWADNWRGSFRNWVYPLIGDKLVADITTDDIEGVLHQNVVGEGDFAFVRNHTAIKVRSRIAKVITVAMRKKYREPGLNPAALNVLAELPADEEGKPHACVPYAEMPALMKKLNGGSVVDRAIAFTALTGVRTKPVRLMTWNQIDKVRRVWTMPRAVTKCLKHDFRVPLSDAAMAILDEMERHRHRDAPDAAVFPARNKTRGNGKFLGQHTMRRSLQVKFSDFRSEDGEAVTIHGFRSGFGDWCEEQSGCPDVVSEAALGHVVGSRVRRRYKRTDYLELRRQLMANWATYCMTGRVVRWKHQSIGVDIDLVEAA
jgi:integrase